ncbi:Uncharacterised protein [Mycobacteroides abscessus subsp. abscessus]|nr:Uncharacterised protein [Mycobacteroides abscessus subsp. abscessus]
MMVMTKKGTRQWLILKEKMRMQRRMRMKRK